ncbi:MAG: metalloregulator ArsR/SmtB family transcription factor [Candidatus Pacebacteria bacterium]|nr:metalloregulator ArsR/SmtB family transcription factor [Candidatus Paceibacterota bacterium]
MDQCQLESAAKVLRALAHPVRLGVLQCLAVGEYTVSELTETIGCSQSMMSQQLATLERQHLIVTRKEGTLKYCAIQNPDFLKMLNCLESHLHKYLHVNINK